MQPLARGALFLWGKTPAALVRRTPQAWQLVSKDCGVLKAVKPARAEMPLRVVFTRGGERLKPAGSRFTRTLRNLFQEEAIPPWIRERLPLVELDGELAAVADRFEVPALKKLRGQTGFRYQWQHQLPGDPT